MCHFRRARLSDDAYRPPAALHPIVPATRRLSTTNARNLHTDAPAAGACVGNAEASVGVKELPAPRPLSGRVLAAGRRGFSNTGGAPRPESPRHGRPAAPRRLGPPPVAGRSASDGDLPRRPGRPEAGPADRPGG